MNEQQKNPMAEDININETVNETAEISESQAPSELEAVTAERDEWKDKSYRLAAEMENLKKRTAKELVEARKYSVANFARELLAVQDNLERALLAMQNAKVEKSVLEPMVEGVQMVRGQLSQAFEKAQIKRIKTIGEKANPELHQVMMEIPDEKAEAGTIIQEMQAGYTIAERLLRPALVGVSKKSFSNST